MVNLTQSIRVLDLFSGAGGFTEGFKQASTRFSTVRAVESDLSASATYEENHGIGTVYAGEIQEWLKTEVVPSSELIIGGPPCQGFSNLGSRKANDERNLLWSFYAETLLRAQPRYFILENVSNFQKSEQYRTFENMTSKGQKLEDFAFESAILNAAHYGAPQLRKRAIVVGWHRDFPRPNLDKLKNTNVDPDEYMTFGEAVSDLPEKVIKTDLPNSWVLFRGKKLPGVFQTTQLHLTRNYTELSKKRFARIGPGQNRFAIPDELLPKCWKGYTTGSFDVMGRIHENKPSVTIRTEFFKPEKGRYLHPTEDRAITHLEAARLQGFPDSYKWVGSKTSIARQIGNAVPIPLATAIASALLENF